MGREGSVASQRTATTLLPRAPAPAMERPATALLVMLAGVSFIAHMLVAGNYGYFRDELYYIADGRHLQAGYVDQPLLMGWLAALLRVIAGDSLVAIHIIPALACAGIIVVTSLTRTVEQVSAALPPAQRAQACVLTSNYGEAGALQLLGRPGRMPPVISGHNNYYLWGPGACTGNVLIVVGYSPSDIQGAHAIYAHITLAATERCRYCVSYEKNLPIYVLSSPTSSVFPRLWPSLKHDD